VLAELPRPVAVGSPKQAHCELGDQTDYADRLGRRVWITNRSNRNRSNSSQLWICASLWARRVNTWFDRERSNNVRVRDNGHTAKARLVRYAVKVPSEANSGA
jgi:hypothetical protein